MKSYMHPLTLLSLHPLCDQVVVSSTCSHFAVNYQPWAGYSDTCAPVTKQYSFTPAKGWSLVVVGKITDKLCSIFRLLP